MLTRMYLYSTSTKLSIDVWLYLDRPGSLTGLDSVFGIRWQTEGRENPTFNRDSKRMLSQPGIITYSFLTNTRYVYNDK